VTVSISLYAPRESGLHRLHPLTKIVFALLGVVAGVTLPGIWPNYAVFGLVLVPLAIWGHILPEFVRSLPGRAPIAISLRHPVCSGRRHAGDPTRAFSEG
jgi:energy-coupling factor transport system permease protein